MWRIDSFHLHLFHAYLKIKDSFAFAMISLSFNRVHNNVHDSMGRKEMSASSLKGFCCHCFLMLTS